MANIDTNLVILALTMPIAQQTHFSSIWDDALNFNSDLMLRPLLLSVAKSVVDHFVIEVFGHVCVATCPDTKWLLCLL